MKLSFRQIVASAVGAVLAAVLASLFGVKGTIIGVAVGSAVATTGTALVSQSIDRTQQMVRQVVVRPVGTSAPSVTTVEDAPTEILRAEPTTAAPEVEERDEPRRFHMRWQVWALSVAAAFVLALVVVTVIELLIGEPLSASFGVHGAPGSGPSVANVVSPSPPATTTTTHAPATTTTSSTTTTSTSTSTTTPRAGNPTTSTSTTTTTTSTGATSTTTTTTASGGTGSGDGGSGTTTTTGATSGP